MKKQTTNVVVDRGRLRLSRRWRKTGYSITPLLLLLPLVAYGKLNVVATLPDLGSLAREIGGDNVNVTVLAKPTEDPHFVDARPSFVVALRSADVLIDGGAELELGWLPPHLQNARNAKLDDGKPRLSEDDIQRDQFGPRGVLGKPDPAKMTPQREKKTPKDVDPGHTA